MEEFLETPILKRKAGVFYCEALNRRFIE